MSDEAIFYRQLLSFLAHAIQDAGMSEHLKLDEINDKDGRLQLTIRDEKTRGELAVLNFSGSVPSLYLQNFAYPLEIVGPDLARIAWESRSEFTAQGLATSIAAKLSENIKLRSTAKANLSG